MAQTAAQKAAAKKAKATIKARATTKATSIAAQDQARTDEYQKALVAPAKTQQEVNAINAGVKQFVESTGGTYDGSNPLTVFNQNSLNPNVLTTNNFSTGKQIDTTPDLDAFEMLKSQLVQWNLGSLADSFMSLATQGYNAAEAMNKIKYDTTINKETGKAWNFDYTERFSGNAARTKQGLNAYSEAEYLTLEDSYADTLRRNNLSNLLSVDAKANQKKFASYMEKGLSADAFAGRIDTYFERVGNMDPNIKNQFKAYYPGINDTDIVSYLADPENTLPVLRNKITAAEIGASALRIGLKATSKENAEMMAKAGKTAAQAEAGYEQIGGFLSDAELYGQIYQGEGINYDQATAEQDIIMGQAEAGKKRKRLESRARAAFEGSSGRLRTGQSLNNSGSF